MGLNYNLTYTKTIPQTVAPGITNKTITAVNEWDDSTETYWNAQDPSNRTELTGTALPNASSYAVGFALKFYYTLDPSTPYYYVATFSGNNVQFKLINEDMDTATLYYKVGTGSTYTTHGSVAGGGITSFITVFVALSGNTTVYAYAQTSVKAPSEITSL